MENENELEIEKELEKKNNEIEKIIMVGTLLGDMHKKSMCMRVNNVPLYSLFMK